MSTSEQPTTLRERNARLNDSDAEDVKGQVASSSRAAKDKAVAASKDTKDIAIQQVRVAATIGTEAVTSGAYLYPIEGIYYLIRHPHLWKPLAKPMIFTAALSFIITSTMFLFTYLPQAAVLALFNGPLAFVTAVPLVLGESSTIILLLAKAFWLTPVLDNLFDEVLLAQGMTSLVAHGRDIEGSGSGKRLGKALLAPLNRFTKEGIIQYILSFPLNFIPVVGTVFFIFYNGNKQGPNYHARYFQLKRMSDAQKKEEIRKRRGSYTAFGTAVLALNLIPGASIFFALSSAVGAALWAADVEKKAGAQVDVNASSEASQDVSEVGKKVDQKTEL
ncbi:hypothetical protein FRC04_007784 [Tulasnella sp. 424]|nr:hypothetical protein FRC04_007784 [Tulasnella sp. 424]KAG8975260.1 hypothetical protein FRC05_006203 [Tulasnella sp. 425]